MTPEELTELGGLSPFELQDQLLSHAAGSGRTVLDAGKGQPNWVATTPRRAFHLLGGFALDEAQRHSEHPDAGWQGAHDGAAERLRADLDRRRDEPGAGLLRALVNHGIAELGYDPDTWVGELIDGVLGDRYPSPHRMLAHLEPILHEYFIATHCNPTPGGAETPPSGRYRLVATEGGAAAMSYTFRSLAINGLLSPGDRIAIGTPVFSPYLEIPTLGNFGLEIEPIRADPDAGWRYPESEIAKLADPSIKALFLVNPGNPDTRALSVDELDAIVRVVTTSRPDLLILADTAYATFVDGFRSLAADLPRNTICVHSFSKHFGATGQRVAFIAMHEDHVLDELLARAPESTRNLLAARYRSVTPDPSNFQLIDRLTADSRDVALYHIAGLSTPQQVQMTLFAAFFLLGFGADYVGMTKDTLVRRLRLLDEPLARAMPRGEDTHYYALIEVLGLARHHHGEEFARWLETARDPLEVPVLLARRHGVVTLPGTGFDAPGWRVRVSLANQDDEAYPAIAAAILATLDELHDGFTKERPA